MFILIPVYNYRRFLVKTFEVGRILFIYRKNSTKKDKENKGKLCTTKKYIQ